MLGWVALVVGVIILAALAWALFASFTRRRATATAIIERRLRSLEIDPAGFSRQCIDALADEAVALTKHFHGRDQWQSNLQKRAEVMADHVYATVLGKGEFSAERIKQAVSDDAAPIAWCSILAQHDPERFGLPVLDKTQWTNAMMCARQAE